MIESAPGIEGRERQMPETDIRKLSFKLSRETLEELGSVEVSEETKYNRMVGSREFIEKILDQLN